MSASLHKTEAWPTHLSQRVDPSAAIALFKMTVARLVRGRRLLVLMLLFALPILFAGLARYYSVAHEADKTELILIFGLIPQTLMPLTSLIFASGMIQDEIEEQTLTYLLIRPLPRWAIYVVKLAATILVTTVLTTIFTTITYLVIDSNEPDLWTKILPWRPLNTAIAMFLALAAYSSIFGLISVFTRRTLVAGIAYIVALEGVIANIDFAVRKITVMYQFRVLTIRWMKLDDKDWNINLETSPSALWATLNLIIAIMVCTILGAFFFSRKEFRVKTPEGT